MSVLTFGKHKGNDIFSVPSEYLEWGADKLESAKWRQAFEAELKRRRKQKEKEELAIASNPDSKEIFNDLVSRIEQEIENEASEAGYEHELSYYSVKKEAEQRAKNIIASIKAKNEIAKIEAEILQLLGCDENMLSRIESAYWNDELSQRNFAQKEKFEAAVAYCEKKSNLLCQIHNY